MSPSMESPDAGNAVLLLLRGKGGWWWGWEGEQELGRDSGGEEEERTKATQALRLRTWASHLSLVGAAARDRRL
jgi:hypothetical protein